MYTQQPDVCGREFSLSTIFYLNNLFRSSFISLHVPLGGCLEAVYSPTSCAWDSREFSLGTTFSFLGIFYSGLLLSHSLCMRV